METARDKQKISVVMTTYNGMLYIEQQLDSLREQTYTLDEVLIFDDNSTDGTIDYIEQYIRKYDLINWYFFKNSENVGWKDNFHRAIRNATGDIVFFSDQDDVWHLNKVEKMIYCMCQNSNVRVLCCRTNFIDFEGNTVSVSAQALPFGKDKGEYIKPNQINNKFIYTIMPGCTMCVRKETIEQFDCDVSKKLPHDALYWKMETLLGGAYLINESLIDYRIHDNNASGPMAQVVYQKKTKEKRLEEIAQNLEQMLNVLEIYQLCIKNPNQKIIDLLHNLISFCEWRKLIVSKKIRVLNFKATMRKYIFYRNFKMFIGDILTSIK